MPSTRSAGNEIALATDLLDATRRLRRMVRRQFRRFAPDIPPPQIEVLQVIADQPRCSVNEVAGTLQLAPNTVSTLVGTLVDHGLVQRAPSPHDRRARELTLSPEAARLARHWRDRRTEAVASAFATLPASDQHALEHCVPALRRLADALSAL